MGLKKFKNLFIKNDGEKITKNLSIVKNQEQQMASSQQKKRVYTKEENRKAKAEVEQLQNAIKNKLKDPAMSKKAAQIIEQMINTKR